MLFVNDLLFFFFTIQALGIFGLCQIHAFVDYLRFRLSSKHFEILFKSLVFLSATVAGVIGAILTISGKVKDMILICKKYNTAKVNLTPNLIRGLIGFGFLNKFVCRNMAH